MSAAILLDPIFRIPFLTGLCLAVALSLIGALLRMRNEWLAALGLSQIAAAGGMLAALLHWPVMLCAFGAAFLTLSVRWLSQVSNSHHALLILVGWSMTLLLGSFVDHGFHQAESLLRGQLYFAHTIHLVGAGLLMGVAVAGFRWLSPLLLTARFFPDFHRANRRPVWTYRSSFAVLTVSAAVLGTVTIGAFPAFAMLFVPPWIAFVLVDGWYRSVLLTVFIGVVAYLISFTVAMLVDFPFGPVLVAVLVAASALRFFSGARHRVPRMRKLD